MDKPPRLPLYCVVNHVVFALKFPNLNLIFVKPVDQHLEQEASLPSQRLEKKFVDFLLAPFPLVVYG